MTHLLGFVCIFAIVSFALYCMMRERIETNRGRQMTHPAERSDVMSVPMSTPSTVSAAPAAMAPAADNSGQPAAALVR
jgi:hypothetical protein